jgi:hypothetical protein
VEVRVGILPGRQDRRHLEHRNNKTPIRQTSGHRDTPRGPVFSTPCRQATNQRTPYRAPPQQQPHRPQQQQYIDMFCRIDQDLKTLDQQILPLELGAPALRMDVGLVENPTIRDIVLLKR